MNDRPPIRERRGGASSRAPNGWRWAALTNVARLESGHTPSRKIDNYWVGGDIPWLSLKDIRGLSGKRIYETANKPTALGVENSSARVLPANTVAFCRTASVGAVVIMGRAMATSQDFVNWVCGPDLHPEYLYWALKSSAVEWNRLKQGSTHKTIYMPTIERLEVKLPPLPAQRRITDILDRADAVRRKRQEAMQLTDELLRSTFLEMFGDPVTNPKGWQLETLGRMADVQGGLQVTRKRADHPLEVPYLRVANVFRGGLDLSEVKTIRVTPKELERVRLHVGDLLLVEGHGNVEEIGRCATWSGAVSGCVHQNHLIRVRLANTVRPSYASMFLNSPGGRRQMKRLAKTTSGLNTISTTQVRGIRIPVPAQQVQARFDGFASTLNTTREHLARAIQQADNFFNSLVQRAFRGEL